MRRACDVRSIPQQRRRTAGSRANHLPSPWWCDIEAPISGKPGNKAIIRADGKLWGWIGGGCAQPVVVKEALKALADGQPRLVRISPSSSPEEGIVDYTMTCHSGGTLDIYIEPVLPKPHVLILGRSPVAQTLCQTRQDHRLRGFGRCSRCRPRGISRRRLDCRRTSISPN